MSFPETREDAALRKIPRPDLTPCTPKIFVMDTILENWGNLDTRRRRRHQVTCTMVTVGTRTLVINITFTLAPTPLRKLSVITTRPIIIGIRILENRGNRNTVTLSTTIIVMVTVATTSSWDDLDVTLKTITSRIDVIRMNST